MNTESMSKPEILHHFDEIIEMRMGLATEKDVRSETLAAKAAGF